MAVSNECRRSEGILLVRPGPIIPPDPEPYEALIWQAVGTYSRKDSIMITSRDNINLASELWADSTTHSGFELAPVYLPDDNIILYGQGVDIYSNDPLDASRTLRVDTVSQGLDQLACMVIDPGNDRVLAAFNDTWDGATGTQQIGYVNTTTWVVTVQDTTIRAYDLALNNTTDSAYIIDYENGKLIRRVLSTMASTGDESTDLGDPYVGVAVDEANDYLYAIKENGKILRFDGQDIAESVTPAVVIVNDGTLQVTQNLVYDPDTDELLTLNDTVNFNYHSFPASVTGQDYATAGTDLGQIYAIEGGWIKATLPLETYVKPAEPNPPGPTSRNKILASGAVNFYICDKLDPAGTYTELLNVSTVSNNGTQAIYIPNQDLIVYQGEFGDIYTITPADTGNTLRVDVSTLTTGGTFVNVGPVSGLVYDHVNDQIIASFSQDFVSNPSIGFINPSTWIYTEAIDSVEATFKHQGHPFVGSLAGNFATEAIYWVVKTGGDHNRIYRRNLSDLLTTGDYTSAAAFEAVVVDEVRDIVFGMTREGEVIVYDGQDLRGQYVRPKTVVTKYPFAGVFTYSEGGITYDSELNEIIMWNSQTDHLHSWDASSYDQNLAASTDLGAIATQTGSWALRSINTVELP